MSYFLRFFSAFFIISVAMPLWAACKANIPTSKPDGQYTDHGNGTVTDKKTQLMWAKCSLGQALDESKLDCTGTATAHTWEEALAAAQTTNQNNELGYNDWRLPNINELYSLVEVACSSPAINKTLFPNKPNGFNDRYWSASPYTRDPAQAWFVRFDGGVKFISNKSDLSNSYHVRLVRGAQ